MKTADVIVVGAGVGGLMASLILSGRGLNVVLLERAATPGGKMRQRFDGNRPIDAGPTVFTLKRIFQEAFDSVGLDFDALVPTRKASVLARHAWNRESRFDLFADVHRSIESVADFAGCAEAEGFRRFVADSARIWRTLERSFVRAPKPEFMGLLRGAGVSGLADLLATRPFQTMWRALGDYFRDPRLRQLFGRYSTYCGSSPYQAPATLMLVAHVEQDGVWMIDGGMHRLAQIFAEMAGAFGADICYGAHVTSITPSSEQFIVQLQDGQSLLARSVVFNGDASAIGRGFAGADIMRAVEPTPRDGRSLSALTWTFESRTRDFPLVRHNVFFSNDYAAEFDAVARNRLIADPTVYLCAQDRGDDDAPLDQTERILALVNATPNGDVREFTAQEISECATRMTARLNECGLTLETPPKLEHAQTPMDFDRLFPATGGALYGRASHGWRASFQRPGVRTKIPGLYLAGGSVHPGPGVPMAALSGWAAANCVLQDLTSRFASRTTATRGGTSTRSAMTAHTG
ncbi:MAG: 1-hydroxycarotenoid 3,4-desaturase CrtD [Beijerinckiaceae bacterium]